MSRCHQDHPAVIIIFENNAQNINAILYISTHDADTNFVIQSTFAYVNQFLHAVNPQKQT